jgi:hypothetical protein
MNPIAFSFMADHFYDIEGASFEQYHGMNLHGFPEFIGPWILSRQIMIFFNGYMDKLTIRQRNT